MELEENTIVFLYFKLYDRENEIEELGYRNMQIVLNNSIPF